MKTRFKPAIGVRKRPRQARSVQLVDDILEAAVRVLTREGARRFTTVRVAEEAGVSVGSLYQYFPSKEALLFRLQANEWTETWGIMEEILGDRRRPPLDRLRRAVLTFFRSEREEASLRVALDDAGALFRDAPEARAHVAKAKARVLAFVEEVLPEVAHPDRVFAADFIMDLDGGGGREDHGARALPSRGGRLGKSERGDLLHVPHGPLKREVRSDTRLGS